MKTFHQLYDQEAPIWNIYLQFVFSDLENEAPPSLERAIEWFRQYPGFEGFPGETNKELISLTNVTAESVEELSPEHGIEFLENTITEAIHYSTSRRLETGGARVLAESFMAEFKSPRVFSNWTRGTGPYHWGGCCGYVTREDGSWTLEYFLCCIDRKRIGFVFSLNNE
ncbi:hypothetical protein [Prosthecobacter sp.]|uniref:hypothetical protein n=1 Tax=Prosthecobacter sp. TaxID=1965333 RepID=UPI0037834D28